MPAARLTGRWVMPILRATPIMALLPSVHKIASLASMGLSASKMCVLSSFSRMKSVVLPARITTNQHRNLFIGQAALGGLAATFARRSWHCLLPALERFKEKGFICFSDAHQAGGLAAVGLHKKSMAPAKGGVAMHVTGLGAFTHALPLLHLPRVVQPLVFVAQSRQRCSCQCIECGLAGRAAVSIRQNWFESGAASRGAPLFSCLTQESQKNGYFRMKVNGMVENPGAMNPRLRGKPNFSTPVDRWQADPARQH